mgnify:CR=1 FL=1
MDLLSLIGNIDLGFASSSINYNKPQDYPPKNINELFKSCQKETREEK